MKKGYRNRLKDVQDALSEGHSMSWLSDRWNVTRAAVTTWCDKYVDPADHKRLAENGMVNGANRRRSYDIGARLEVIQILRKLDWSWARIGQALGCNGSVPYQFVQRYAPFGIDEALEDFADNEAEAA